MMLYIHIPFCQRKCYYCDFLSFAGSDDYFEDYTKALCNEIRLRAFPYPTTLTSIYIGGGTPSILPTSFLESIMDTIKRYYTLSDDCEITIEINPGVLSNTLATALPSIGINRVSLGLQSADNEELKLLGRLHYFSDFLKAFEMVSRAGIGNISVDIMTGIPRQSLPSLEKTLRIVTGLRPSHISTYALTLEKGTAFYRRYTKGSAPLPDDESEYNLYRLAIDYLTGKGYNRYEISNFAKDGMESRHNLGYWNRDSYIGVGLGASSFYDHTRYKNITNLEEYISLLNGDYPDMEEAIFSEITKLSQKDEISEFMYLGLRKTSGVLLGDFEKSFGEPMDAYYGKLIEYLSNEGFLERQYGRVKLTDLGIDVSNQVLSNFLLD